MADRINTTLRPSPLPLRLIGRGLMITPVSAIGWLLDATTSTDTELYLDNFMIGRKPSGSPESIGGNPL
jgi:hypothetical protein